MIANRRIIFIGLHNKPGMKPLDSKTRSGKLIDRIIRNFPNEQCVKFNLFDLDYLPNEMDYTDVVKYWIDVIAPTKQDILILLGRIVHEEAPIHANDTIKHFLKCAHPASIWSNKGKDEYVTRVSSFIQSALQVNP
jgi:hypothetical protein